MKRLLTLLIALAFPFIAISQNWMEDFVLPAESKSSQNFYEIQKNFNEYWSNYDVKGGYYYIDGQKQKAAGWKQFKRWEWYWETRIDRKTGEFPSVNPLKMQKEFAYKANPKADLSNWEVMGPNSSEGGYAGIGRINCIAFHPSNPDIFWIGAPSGGLWKTTDGGNTWEVLTDTLPVIGVSTIFIPNDYETSKTIYIGTGDRDAGDNYSIGVLKSTDDGLTWEETGLIFNVADRYRVTRMLVHPTQQNIFYVATNGGIYKSTNSGENWTEVLDGVFFDMEFKYGCEDTVLYAVTADYSGAPKLYKTNDAGVNWDIKYTFPVSTYRIELDGAQSDSTIIYALACTQSYGMDGIYKSENSGESFTKIYNGLTPGNNLLNWYAGDTKTSGQGWYDLTLSVSPTNENELYLGGINSWKSTDGGYNWDITSHWYGYGGVPAVHADKHFMEYLDGNTFFEANDGGIYKTSDGGAVWIDLTDGMVISQMYKLSVSQTVKDEVITGLQDNGSKLTIAGNWWDVKGGDGMECLIDYTDEEVQYATYANGQIDRTIDHWNNVDDISANIPGGANGAWVTPYVIDPVDNQTIYVGYADVWKTTNRGNSWTKISTLNLSNKIRSMAIAPSDNQTLYIADLDYFYRTTNGGGNWSNLTANLPSTSNSITYISVDATDPMHIWITFGGYDNLKAFESLNGGESWTDISAGLPSVPANTIIQNKLSKTQQLYAGTDMGVYFKEGSGDWTLFSNKLPVVIVTELEIHYDNTTPENSVLYASTYGRGLWKSNLSAFETPEIQVGSIEGPFYVSDDSTASIQVDYVINETFTSNTFTAYLSDETGSFANPVEIGSLVSDVEGTIDAKIPVGTVSGSEYRVKVISSNPVFESTLSDPFEIILDNVHPSVIITSNESSLTSAENFNVTITFDENVTGFEQSDIVVNNATINSFNSTNAPVYQINISPTAAGNVSIDIPADVAYDIVGNWNTAASQWNINYTPISLGNIEGPFYVSDDSTAMIQVDFVINETFSSNTFTAYLSDETGSFTNQVEIGNLVSDAEGAIDAKIPVSTVSGTAYKVKVVSSSPVFESTTSNPFEVILDNVHPLVIITSNAVSPITSDNVDVTITFNENVTGFEQADIVVSNATINSFNSSGAPVYKINISPIVAGDVSVDIPADVAHDIIGNWNTASSQWSINYAPVGIDDLNSYGINLYPNPSNGIVTIDFVEQYEKIIIAVIDIAGKEVYRKEVNEKISHTLDLSDLAKSIYFIKLTIGDKELVSKLVIK